MRIKLGIPMTLGEIAYSVNGKANLNKNILIKQITTDSREAEYGDLYIPMKGSKLNGEDFIDDAINKGCYAISSANKNAHILVNDSKDALLNLATYYNKNLPYILYRIGITGSVGKTTTKEFLKLLLSSGYKVHASEGNFNNEIGLPLSILSAPRDTQILIMEMGMNHEGEIRRLSKCLNPSIALITKIGSSHIGNLGSRENIAKSKLEIAEGMVDGHIFVPSEEPLLSGARNKVTTSLNDSNADYYLEANGHKISIYKRGEKYTEANFSFLENHLRECLLFAASISIDMGLPPDLLSASISRISNDNIRQRTFSLAGYRFIDDSYNASFESILASFETVKNTRSSSSKGLLLGDVLELGEYSKSIHYKIGQSIPREIFNEIFLIGNFAEYTARGALENGFHISKIHTNPSLDRPDITADQIKHHCPIGELILMKASRGVRLERVIDFLKERTDTDE